MEGVGQHGSFQVTWKFFFDVGGAVQGWRWKKLLWRVSQLQFKPHYLAGS